MTTAIVATVAIGANGVVIIKDVRASDCDVLRELCAPGQNGKVEAIPAIATATSSGPAFSMAGVNDLPQRPLVFLRDDVGALPHGDDEL